MRLLAELLGHINEVVTKDELLQSVWDGRTTVEQVLPNAISKLRTALGPAGAARLVTLPRVGYRLQGPVQRVDLRAPEHRFEPGQPVPGREAWLLERPLGDGARSDVWLARHAKLGQVQVFKFADDGARLSALKREYTLYRVLKQELGPRDDFASVVDANFAAAPYFLQCGYGGQSLQEWAETDGRLAAMPQAERLVLFLQIARAVAAAHSVGVLHKDLKPGNVLVDAAPGAPGTWQLRLTDFGSGRALNPERLKELGLTAMGLTLTQATDVQVTGGTLLYLAPELLQGGSATTQSDLYALGLMLYQMLVGDFKRPLVSGWQREVGDELLAQDILAATEGEPSHRLASVGALVELLQTLEERRAQRLRDAQAAEQADKLRAAQALWRARRPWLVATATSVLLGLGVSLYSQWQARQALHVAQDERERASAIGDFLQRDLLESPYIMTMGSVRPSTMLQLLRQAAATVGDRFAGRPRDEAALRRRLGEAFMRIASLGDARAQVDIAAQLLVKAAPADDEERLTLLFLSAHLNAWRLNFKKAQIELDEAEALAGAQRMARSSEMVYQFVRARHAMLYFGNRMQEALPNVERLVVLADAVYPNTPSQRADARQRKAEVLHFMGRADDAAALVDELQRPPFNAKRMATEFKANIGWKEADGLDYQSRWDEALALRLAAHRALLADDPPNEYFLAWSNYILADNFHSLGQFDKAQTHYEEAGKAFERVVGADHQYTQSPRLSMAFNLLALRRYAQALAEFQQVQTWNDTVGNKLFSLLLTFGRAMAHTGLGRQQEAIALMDGLQIRRPEDEAYARNGEARIDAERARALLALGRREEALAKLEPAVKALEAAGSWPWLIAEYRALAVKARSAAGSSKVVAAARP